MYNKLVKRLRDAAKMSEALAVLLPHSKGSATAKLFNEAADAIEELSAYKKIALDEHNRAAKKAWEHRWISVEERLPKEWWPVLGLLQFPATEEPPSQEVLWYLGNGHWRSCWNADMIESPISHWMPLPEPPKVEE